MAANWWPDDIAPGDRVACVRLVLWEDANGVGIHGPGLNRSYEVIATRSAGSLKALRLAGWGGWWAASCFSKVDEPVPETAA